MPKCALKLQCVKANHFGWHSSTFFDNFPPTLRLEQVWGEDVSVNFDASTAPSTQILTLCHVFKKHFFTTPTLPVCFFFFLLIGAKSLECYKRTPLKLSQYVSNGRLLQSTVESFLRFSFVVKTSADKVILQIFDIFTNEWSHFSTQLILLRQKNSIELKKESVHW